MVSASFKLFPIGCIGLTITALKRSARDYAHTTPGPCLCTHHIQLYLQQHSHKALQWNYAPHNAEEDGENLSHPIDHIQELLLWDTNQDQQDNENRSCLRSLPTAGRLKFCFISRVVVEKRGIKWNQPCFPILFGAEKLSSTENR